MFYTFLKRKINMATYLFSDPHFNHGNIIKYSKRLCFMTTEDMDSLTRYGPRTRMSDESIQRMNQGIIDNINAVVQPNDTIYCLGDWCFGSKDNYLNVAKDCRDKINCNKIHLIWGNHDQFNLRRLNIFETCQDMARIETEAGEFFLCHYPMISWDKSHHGVMHAYGHVHGLYYNNPPVAFPESWAAFDAGVDVEERYGVWSVVEIADRLCDKVQAAKHRRD